MQVQQINVRTTSAEVTPGVITAVREKLKSVHRGVENFSVESGETVTHSTGSLLGIISAMLSVVAGVSLVVGGLGVMNIMLVSVAERTREIGIRKSVGAATSHILMQFLFESLILAIIGGALGLGLGLVVAFLVSLVTPFPPFVSLPIVGEAFLIALIVGVVFGLIPALRAARKDPIDSLKFYR
jgi:ABC-type antimicrobial peptide transport system permease subunit